MKLHIIYIGGIHEKAFVELHDMRFAVAKRIEDTYDYLKSSWWGTQESLHIDAWGVLEYADGHNIHLSNEPSTSENKLYFVNLGGYNSNEFTELHKNVFVVAPNPSKAKVRALKQILDWESHHRDYQFEMENIVDLSAIASAGNYYINLEPSDIEKKFEFTCKFIPIGR
ncbi:MAG: DUF1543 domain-containing protein [Rickettsiales bacterium]